MFPTNILVVADCSEGAYLTLQAATELAGGTGSELHIVHVVPEQSRPYSWANSSWAKEKDEAQLEWRRLRGLELLDAQARHVEEELWGTVTATHFREERPEQEVVRLGEEIDAGLSVTKSQRRS